MTKTAVVLGVGPVNGLGGQLCLRLAQHGLHVIVAGRTQASLDAVVAEIGNAGGSANAMVADATIETDVNRLFESAGADLDLAIYNAGNNTPGRIVDMDASLRAQLACLLLRRFSIWQSSHPTIPQR